MEIKAYLAWQKYCRPGYSKTENKTYDSRHKAAKVTQSCHIKFGSETKETVIKKITLFYYFKTALRKEYQAAKHSIGTWQLS